MYLVFHARCQAFQRLHAPEAVDANGALPPVPSPAWEQSLLKFTRTFLQGCHFEDGISAATLVSAGPLRQNFQRSNT